MSAVHTPLDLARLKTCLTAAEIMMLKGRTAPAAAMADLRDFNVPDDLKARAAKETGRVVGHVVMQMVRRQHVDHARVERLFKAMEGSSPSLALDAVAYIHATCALAAALKDARMDTASDLRPVQSEMLGIVRRHADQTPQATSLAILEGGLLSLTDRSAAARRFASATRSGPAGMATSVFDLGAHTYVDERDLLDPGEGQEGAAITRALRGTDRPALGYLVMSADVDFLRLYGPHWFSFAAMLQAEGLGLVIAVIGPGDEVTRLIDQSRDMIARIGRFRHENGERTAGTVIFVPLPDPATPEAKTYYACARHLIALPLIEATGAPVLIVDADQVVEQSVAPFVRGLAAHDVGVIGARGLGSVWPWRRHMAGSGWFNATPGGLSVLRSVGRYIRANLHRAPSWTLDQNAVSFALEAHPEAGLHINGSSASPFIQPGVRSQQEKLWRTRKAAMAA